jgi:histidine triad (HIT) family protein
MADAAKGRQAMSLDGAYDDGNIFAKILRGEAPAAKVFEDDQVFAFMDVFPQARGHVLVISKESKARNLLEVEPQALEHLILGVQRVARAVRAALKPDAIAVMQFNGAVSGQSVFHLHFHIVPRWSGVALKPHGEGGMADAAELAILAKSIAAMIS